MIPHTEEREQACTSHTLLTHILCPKKEKKKKRKRKRKREKEIQNLMCFLRLEKFFVLPPFTSTPSFNLSSLPFPFFFSTSLISSGFFWFLLVSSGFFWFLPRSVCFPFPF